MKPLVIAPTHKTPRINFDPEKSVFELTGRSFPEDVNKFYSNVLQWLQEYCATMSGKLVLNIYLEQLNTASSKQILELLKILDDAYKKGNDCKLIWIADEDDEDMIDQGEDYGKILEIPVEIKKNPVNY
jgi:hypothetical protein